MRVNLFALLIRQSADIGMQLLRCDFAFVDLARGQGYKKANVMPNPIIAAATLPYPFDCKINRSSTFVKRKTSP